MTHSSEFWAVKKKDESKLKLAEMRFLDDIRNTDISAHKTCGNFPGKLKIKVVWSLPETRTKRHLCKIDKIRSFGEKEQRSTEKETEGQHKGRYEKI